MQTISIPKTALVLSLLVSLNAGCGTKNGLWRRGTLDSEIARATTSLDVENSTARFWQESFEFASRRAELENKLVMANFTGTDWCPFCIKLEDEVFHTPEFESWARENVIPLKLDYPKKKKLAREQAQQNQELLERYNQYIGGYPTVLFLNPQGDVVAKMGYAKGGPTQWISKAEDKLKN